MTKPRSTNNSFNLDISEIVRRKAIEAFAVSFQQDVLPLLSGFNQREQLTVLCVEFDRFLKTYCAHLEEIARRSHELAQDAINSSLARVVILPSEKPEATDAD